MYQRGGIISVTSRILIVDLLNQLVPTQLVAGLIINHAQKHVNACPYVMVW